MTVAELRRALEGVPDDMPVLRRAREWESWAIPDTAEVGRVENVKGDGKTPAFLIS
jgi:hypothetical protein